MTTTIVEGGLDDHSANGSLVDGYGGLTSCEAIPGSTGARVTAAKTRTGYTSTLQGKPTLMPGGTRWIFQSERIKHARSYFGAGY